MEYKSIYDLVREAEDQDKNGETTTSKYVQVSLREDVDKTEAYLNSKHISGEKDSLGRDKPFFDIVTSARNIWFRATDIDRKNISFRATKESSEIKAFLLTLKLQEWMKSVNFGQFLNDWGLTLANHGSAITKFVEKEGQLYCQVEDWNDMIVDAVDFKNNIKIKKLWLTPAQLKKQKAYNQDIVEQLLNNLVSREVIGGQKKDNKSNYILLYEVHGELPLSYLTGEESDEETYVQQMHIINYQQNDETGKFDNYTLYSGREKKEPNYIAHLIKKDGQSYAGGAVKNLFQAQWMVNHTQKQIKDHLDLASKMLFQTADGNFVGQNALTRMYNGQILIHQQNMPLTQLNNKADIGALQGSQQMWQSNGLQINGISEAMSGEAPKAGTAWRQVQAMLQESYSLFDLMRENKGLAIEEMFREYIIPFFKKQLRTKDEISAILDDHQIKEFDSRYIPNEAIRRTNRKKIDTILSGEIYDPIQEGADLQTATQAIQNDLKGNQRFIHTDEMDSKTWEEVIGTDDVDIVVDITGESTDTQSQMATLDSALKFLTAKQGMPFTDDEKLVFNKLMTLAGTVSPLELSFNKTAAPPMQPALPGASVGAVPMK